MGVRAAATATTMDDDVNCGWKVLSRLDNRTMMMLMMSIIDVDDVNDDGEDEIK